VAVVKVYSIQDRPNLEQLQKVKQKLGLSMFNVCMFKTNVIGNCSHCRLFCVQKWNALSVWWKERREE